VGTNSWTSANQNRCTTTARQAFGGSFPRMDTIITIGTAYGIPDHILHEYCTALDIEDCFDGLPPEDAERAAVIIAVELCHADRLNVADELRQHALRESDERVARALVVAADT
jgi:hypothetical protein